MYVGNKNVVISFPISEVEDAAPNVQCVVLHVRLYRHRLPPELPRRHVRVAVDAVKDHTLRQAARAAVGRGHDGRVVRVDDVHACRAPPKVELVVRGANDRGGGRRMRRCSL